MTNQNAIEKMNAVVNAYRQMPNGGAALNVLPDGKISNGYTWLTQFSSPRAATKHLQSIGFVRRSWGWKLVR